MIKTVDPIKAGIFDRILSPLRKKEGFRNLLLGDSGMGKTTANRMLINESRKSGIDLVLSVDDKNRWEHQYEGCFRINPNHLRAHPPGDKEDGGHVVFRGICYSDESLRSNEGINSEDVSSMGWDLVRLRPIQVLVNIDELADAVISNSQIWEGESMQQSYRKGRAVGISITATTQMPQMLPRETFALSDTIIFFRMQGRETKYLYGKGTIDKDEMEVIRNLKVGEFLFQQKSQPKDTNIYKLEKYTKVNGK